MAADAEKTRAKQSAADPSGGAGPAGNPAQLQELSRKLLDLWQDHLSAVAQDPNLLAQALKLMTAAPFAWMPGFSPAGFSTEGGPGFAQSPNPFQPGIFGAGIFGGQPAGPAAARPAAPGAATSAAAPAAGADDVGQLRRRLAELEGRLAQLEGAKSRSGPGSAGGKAPAGAGKPRRRAAKS